MQRTTVIFKSPYEIKLTRSPLPVPGEEEVLIKSQISGISAGTELLVYRGQFPPKMSLDAAIPALTRPFSYPLAYGYSSVGKVVEIGRSVNKELLGRSVFCFHPHESHYAVRQDQLVQLPDDIDPVNAVFLATMETAVNFLMDGRPVIGENVVIFGQGIVGLLTALLLSRLPLGKLVALDPNSQRRANAEIAGIQLALDPEISDAFEDGSNLLKTVADGDGADLVFELSGNPAALNQALAIAGPGARIVIGSWYGAKKAELDLGGRISSKSNPADQQPGQHPGTAILRPLDQTKKNESCTGYDSTAESGPLRHPPLSRSTGCGGLRIT